MPCFLSRLKRLTFLSLLIFAVVRCSGSEGPPPDRGFTADELLIDETAFPSGWYANPPFDLAGPIVGKAREYERVGRSFYDYGSGAIQNIYRYGSEQQAAKQFSERWRRVFHVDRFTSEWVVPDALFYQSSFADQLHLACAMRSKYVCRALGQYKEYVVLVSVDMAPSTNVTHADFKRIVAAMEDRIALRLGLQ